MSKTKYYTHEEWQALTSNQKHEVEKRQLFKHLAAAGTKAAEFFLERLADGKIAGQHYWNGMNAEEACGCVLGTLRFAQTESYSEAMRADQTYDWDTEFRVDVNVETFDEDEDDWDPSYSVVEALAFNIVKGETPDTNENARLLYDWTAEWLNNQKTTI